MRVEVEFRKLKDQANISKVEPLMYTGLFIVGVICSLLSLNWVMTVIFFIIRTVASQAKYITSVATDGEYANDVENTKEKTYLDLINWIMTFTVEKNMGFVSNIIFISMALYLYAVAQKGNATIGFRFASPTFYPMRSNET